MSQLPNSDVLLQPHGPGFEIGPGSFPEVKEDEIALMFSGGVDSTATAIMLAEKYKKVHLITDLVLDSTQAVQRYPRVVERKSRLAGLGDRRFLQRVVSPPQKGTRKIDSSGHHSSFIGFSAVQSFVEHQPQ